MTWPDNDRVSDSLRREPANTARRYTVVLVIVGVAAIVGLAGLSALTAEKEEVVAVTTAAPGALTAHAVDPAIAMRNPSVALPDFDGALLENQATGRLELGVVGTLPGDIYLDFLIDGCHDASDEDCYLDAAFVSATRPEFKSSAGQIGEPFHVRHGFVNDGTEPLGPDFDVLIYIIPTGDTPGENRLGEAPIERGRSYRFSSDYVIRGVSDRCGPTYDTQTQSVTCEWFVHDFPQGLPEGRYDMWAVWQAPCWAWIEFGFIDQCAGAEEVLSLFSSGVNSPVDATAWSATRRLQPKP